MRKAFKFRIYPTKTQATLFAKIFGCARFIYNKMLADKIEHYEATGKSLYIKPTSYKDEFPWLREVDSLALANAYTNLNRAFENFFKNPKHFGKPSFKARKSRQSYQTNNQKGSVRIENGRIKLPRVGFVKISMHRPLEPNSTIKTVTVSRTPTGKYFVSILVEYENQVLPVVPHSFLGLDFAMHGLFVASDGERAAMPRFLKEKLGKLARAQRKLARRKKGSKNWLKQKLVIAKIHEQIANLRRDFLHKLSTDLADRFDLIGIEDLNIKAMARKKKGRKFSFGKSVGDLGWAEFVGMLAYKMEWRGRHLVRVGKKFPSSKLCNVCGHRNEIVQDLSVREYDCGGCGTHLDRDLNAAINIELEAKRLFFL